MNKENQTLLDVMYNGFQNLEEHFGLEKKDYSLYGYIIEELEKMDSIFIKKKSKWQMQPPQISHSKVFFSPFYIAEILVDYKTKSETKTYIFGLIKKEKQIKLSSLEDIENKLNDHFIIGGTRFKQKGDHWLKYFDPRSICNADSILITDDEEVFNRF